jgi:CO/xanthine dehydrogenase Mo-binding subunit
VSAVGQRIPARASVGHVRGATRFVDDLAPPGTLVGKAVLSNFHHAKVLRVDTTRAARVPGVRLILTASDIPNNVYGTNLKDQPLLVSDRVRHKGDVVAFVVATDADAAAESAALVEVEYEELPAIFDVEASLEPGAMPIHDWGNLVPFNERRSIEIKRGDVESALRSADLVLTQTYRTQAMEHAHLEPHAALATTDGEGKVTIWSPIQVPFTRVAEIAWILNLPLSRVKLVVPPIGGGFGGKNDVTMEPLVALASVRLAKPVKCTWTRAEEFLSSSVRHPYVMTHTIGLKSDGTILAKKVDALGDAGPYTNQSPAVLSALCLVSCGPYRVPNVSITGRLAYTNNEITGAYRGYGGPQATFAVESQLDSAARALGIDPFEIRMKNALQDGDMMPTAQQHLHGVGLKRCLERIAETIMEPAR